MAIYHALPPVSARIGFELMGMKRVIGRLFSVQIC